MYCTRCGTWTPDEASACARCGEPRVAPPPAYATSLAAPVRGTAPAPAPATAGPRPARAGGFWRRFAASVVDALVLFFPDAILRVALGVPTAFDLHPAGRDASMGALATALTVSTLLGWLYCALLESSRAQGTLGQQLLDLRVTDLAGRRLSFGRATARHFAQVVSVLLCGLGYLFNLWTARRQTLHDLLAGCVIVRPAPVPAAQPAEGLAS